VIIFFLFLFPIERGWISSPRITLGRPARRLSPRNRDRRRISLSLSFSASVEEGLSFRRRRWMRGRPSPLPLSLGRIKSKALFFLIYQSFRARSCVLDLRLEEDGSPFLLSRKERRGRLSLPRNRRLADFFFQEYAPPFSSFTFAKRARPFRTVRQ